MRIILHSYEQHALRQKGCPSDILPILSARSYSRALENYFRKKFSELVQASSAIVPCTINLKKPTIHSSWHVALFCCLFKCRINLDRDEKLERIKAATRSTWFTVTIPVSRATASASCLATAFVANTVSNAWRKRINTSVRITFLLIQCIVIIVKSSKRNIRKPLLLWQSFSSSANVRSTNLQHCQVFHERIRYKDLRLSFSIGLDTAWLIHSSLFSIRI